MSKAMATADQLRPNADWAKLPLFSRKGWARIRFGDVVENVNERVEPADAAEETYVGLDDLDSGCLHIRRWGKGSDVIGTKLRFRKGDVIFGRRRAYQRKLAVAEVDGICSAHAMVVRAKPSKVLPEFLPFLMMSDEFMNRAVEISVGSLSPTINWTTLKLEEFDLPPLDQQRRTAEVLWAVDEGMQRWSSTIRDLLHARERVITDFVARQDHERVLLGECLEDVQYGSSTKAVLQPGPGLLPLLRIPNVIGGRIDLSDLAWQVQTEEFEKYRLAPGDVLIVRTNGNPDYVGRTAVFEGTNPKDALYASYLIRLRPRLETTLPHFVHEVLQSEQVRRELRKQVRSSAGNYNLNTHGIRGLLIPLPSKVEQQRLIDRLAVLDNTLEALVRNADTLRALGAAIINNVASERTT